MLKKQFMFALLVIYSFEMSSVVFEPKATKSSTLRKQATQQNGSNSKVVNTVNNLQPVISKASRRDSDQRLSSISSESISPTQSEKDVVEVLIIPPLFKKSEEDQKALEEIEAREDSLEREEKLLDLQLNLEKLEKEERKARSMLQQHMQQEQLKLQKSEQPKQPKQMKEQHDRWYQRLVNWWQGGRATTGSVNLDDPFYA